MLHILSPTAVMMPTMAFVSSVRGHGTNSATCRHVSVSDVDRSAQRRTDQRYCRRTAERTVDVA